MLIILCFLLHRETKYKKLIFFINTFPWTNIPLFIYLFLIKYNLKLCLVNGVIYIYIICDIDRYAYFQILFMIK